MSDDILVNHLIEVLEQAVKAMDEAHQSMFSQCLSNPIKNAWGKTVDVSKINELQTASGRAKHTILNYRLNKE